MALSNRSTWRISLRATLAVVFVVLLVFSVPGCGGCKPEDPVAKKKREAEEEKKKKQKEKEKPKPDFELTKVVTFPNDLSDKNAQTNAVKPGHWATTSHLARANNFDFQADLNSQLVDANSKPVDIEKTSFQITLSRPAPLPKGQVKQFEVVVPVGRQAKNPSSDDGAKKTFFLKNTLRATRGGKIALEEIQPLSIMSDHQYFFVVLSSNPDGYAFLKRLSSILPPDVNSSLTNEILHYRVLLPHLETLPVAPLPSHPLTWTNTAFVLWDGIVPSRLSPDQQQSLVDWLHWGGQLIISGPDSLDDLKGSFLHDFLPAEKVEAAELSVNDFRELNETWSLKHAALTKKPLLTFNKTMLGVSLKPRPQAEFLTGTGQLAIERRVGAGRVVVTAFPLSDSRVVTWQNYDNFFNACLLRRPPREFYTHANSLQTGFRWKGLERALSQDARLNSTVRFFTRDLGHLNQSDERKTFDELKPEAKPPNVNNQGFQVDPRPSAEPHAAGTHPHDEHWHFNGYSAAPNSGVAGWNDFSGPALAARVALSDAAGITVPDAGFVIRVLWIYLVVLVPVNWGVFRLIGRVEWAWLAAPIIAVVGAVMVVRGAQLDIGFVRSRTELGVLELQGNYDRGHLTRYSALYTSLSSAYDLTFDDESAIVLPFSADSKQNESPRTVTLRRDRQVHLNDFQVDSNSTSMLHSEQFLKLSGPLKLIGNDEDGWQLENNTDLTIRSVGLLHRLKETSQLEAAWLGDVAPKTTTPIRYVPIESDAQFLKQWDNAPVTQKPPTEKKERQRAFRGEVNLGGMIQLAVNRLTLNRGDVRLIGYCNQDFQQHSDLVISPSIAQVLARTLVLCHLQRGPLPLPVSDRNHRLEFDKDLVEEESQP